MPTSGARVEASEIPESKAGVGVPALPLRESGADHLPSLGLSSRVYKAHPPPTFLGVAQCRTKQPERWERTCFCWASQKRLHLRTS